MVLYVCAAVLLLLSAPLVAYYVDRLGRVLIETNNEGWVAYFADRATAGRPYPAAVEDIVNNYPPAGFYVVGWLAQIFGDTIIAGRWVSVIAFAVTTYCIHRIVFVMTADRAAGVFAASLFVAIFLCFPGGRLGLNDPQLLAHAVMMAGLLVLCRAPQNVWAMLMAALLMALAGLVKHNIVGLPLGATLWIAFTHRRQLGIWLGCMMVAGLAALVLLLASGGIAAIASMATPRVLDWGKGMAETRHWLLLLQAPLVVCAFLAIPWCRTPARTLAFCLVAGGLFELIAFVAGVGVVANVAFDLIIALSVAVGIALAGAPSRPLRDVAAVCLVFHVALHMPMSGVRFLAAGASEKRSEEAALVADIARLRGYAPPYLCLDPVVCYYAGEQFTFDPFNMSQKYRLGTRSPEPILSRIRAGEYTVIELSEERQVGLEPIFEAVEHYYRLGWETNGRRFMLPRP